MYSVTRFPRLPSKEAAEQCAIAREKLAKLPKRAKVQLRAGKTRRVSVTIPREAFDVLLQALECLGRRQAVCVVPVRAEVTTQEAAELLNVSRPYVIKLLDEGKLPCRMVGSHRRIHLPALMALKRKSDEQSRAALAEMVAESEKLGLYRSESTAKPK